MQNLAIGGLVALFYRCLGDREFLAQFKNLSSLLLERGQANRYFHHNDQEEASAITWFRRCWEGKGSEDGDEEGVEVPAEEVTTEDEAAVLKVPTIRFMDHQEMKALGIRDVGRFSVARS